MSNAISTIAVDMDEVLVETFANLYSWHNKTHNTDLVVEKDCKHFAQWLNRGFGDYATFQDKFDVWSSALHQQPVFVVKNAVQALRDLKSLGYRLVIITSRRPDLASTSRDLVHKYFDGIFDEIWFSSGFRGEDAKKRMDPNLLKELLGEEDTGRNHRSVGPEGSSEGDKQVAIRWLQAPKSAVCERVQAGYLIDDSIHNAIEVVDNGPAGIRGILFGDYLWNRHWTDMSRKEFAMSYEERVEKGWTDDLSLTSLPNTVTRCSNWRAVVRYFRSEKRKSRAK